MINDIELELGLEETMFIHYAYVCTWQCHVVDCAGEWAKNRNHVPNRVLLHHQIDQALSFFCVRATLKNREWPGDEASINIVGHAILRSVHSLRQGFCTIVLHYQEVYTLQILCTASL